MSEAGEILDPVERLAREFLDRHRRGDRPAIEEYATRHPELAEQIREVFAALLLLEDFGSVEEGPREATGQELDPAGPRQLGDFRIVRRIGRGGMGLVYEAEQVSLGRRVALKILPFHSLLSPDYLRRFQLEARAAARLHHSNIVPVHEVGEDGGVHYYAMQFIEGEGLDQVLAEIRRIGGHGNGVPERPGPAPNASREVAVELLSGTFGPPCAEPRAGDEPAAGEGSARSSPRSPSSAGLPAPMAGGAASEGHGGYCRSIARIGLQVAGALAHAHAAGVLHRDIKPSNLLLDLKGTVWVTDFGLAKTEGGEELTHSGDVVGTLRYMGPERFQGWSDPRSDVYGLGVTLYELLTLQPAFSARDRPALVREILHVDPPRPRRLDRRIPADLETIILKAIEKEPAKRYPSAAELAGDLRRFLENRPIIARRTSPGERAALWFRRNPLAASLIIMVSLLVVAAAVAASATAVHLSRLAGDLEGQQRSTLAHLRRASMEEARARRLSRRVGQRHGSMGAVSRAAGIEAGIDLRGEAAACLALMDLRRERPEWEFSDSRLSAFTLDPSFERYAYSDKAGAIRVCRVEDGKPLHELAGAGQPVPRLEFSRDGCRLAAVRGEELVIWDLPGGSHATLPRGFWRAYFDFSPDGRLLAAGEWSGGVSLIETKRGEVLRRLECGYRPNHVAFSHDGRLLALGHWQRVVEIWDVEAASLLHGVAMDDVPGGLAWHPGGKLLAAGGSVSYGIHVWDVGSWERPREILQGHRVGITDLRFSPDGDLLASFSFDKKTIIWNVWLGEKLLEYEGKLVDFSRDARRIGFRFANTAEVFEVTRPAAYRRIYRRERQARLDGEIAFSPDGRWLASICYEEGVRLWDIASGDEVAFLDVPALSVLFPAEDQFLTSGERGLQLWPLHHDAEASRGTLAVGPPRTVLTRKSGAMRLDPESRTVVVLQSDAEGHGRPHVVDLDDPARGRSYDEYPYLANLDGSPDGQWIAGGTWHGSGVPLWRAGEPKPVTVLPAVAGAVVRFSPDGRWLAISDGPVYRFLKVGTWHEEWAVPRHRVEEYGNIAFSPDGRVVALPHTLHVIKLFDLAAREEIATLEAPHEGAICALEFSPDGATLAAGTRNHFIHVWDLRDLRRELSTLGLDWSLPPLPAMRGDDRGRE
jgi:eukaryotic-like serine/threonine-protein kinase